MDAGCYAIHMARLLGGQEPTVAAARAKLAFTSRVDRAMTADLSYPGGHAVASRRRCGRPPCCGYRPGCGVKPGAWSVLNPSLPRCGTG